MAQTDIKPRMKAFHSCFSFSIRQSFAERRAVYLLEDLRITAECKVAIG